MDDFELGTNDHGAIGELIASTTAGLPSPIEETIHAHATRNYSSYISDIEIPRKFPLIRSIANQHGESSISHLEGITLPENGDWGYSKGWVPDDIFAATLNAEFVDVRELPDAATYHTDDTNTPPVVSNKKTRTSEMRRMQVYYPIEVKSITSYPRIRLTENQSETFELLANDVDYVHPLLVILDLNGLPETVGIEVDLVEESRWAEGARTKKVK